ncbi:MAG: ATP-grasp domain-containing protein [Solirubrobacterales bacterium]
MSRTRIAIATCADYAGLKADDGLLRAALEERGCETRAVVWDRDEVEWKEFDLCLVRSTWDYHDKHPEFLAWARHVEGASALRNPAELIAWNSDKRYLRELGEREVRTVPTIWVGRDSQLGLEQILAGTGWEEAVVKPVVDLGARNLHRVRAGDGSAALEAVLRRSDAMVQPFLPSLEEQGEVSLIYIGGKLAHAVRKRPAPGDFRVQSIWGGTVSREEPSGAEIELAEGVLAEFKEVPLYARVDLVAGLDGEPCLIELELIEPNLYLGEHPAAAEALAEAALLRIDVNA